MVNFQLTHRRIQKCKCKSIITRSGIVIGEGIGDNLIVCEEKKDEERKIECEGEEEEKKEKKSVHIEKKKEKKKRKFKEQEIVELEVGCNAIISEIFAREIYRSREFYFANQNRKSHSWK